MAHNSKRTYRCITLLPDEQTVCWEIISFPETRCSAHRQEYHRLARDCNALGDKVDLLQDKLKALQSPDAIERLENVNAFAGLVSNVSAVLEAMEKEMAARKSQHVRYCGQVEDHHSIYIRELEEEKLGVLELQRTLYARRNALWSVNHQRINDPPPGYTRYDRPKIPHAGPARCSLSPHTPLLHACHKKSVACSRHSPTVIRVIDSHPHTPTDSDSDSESWFSTLVKTMLFILFCPFLLVGLVLYGVSNLLKWVYAHISIFFFLFIIVMYLMFVFPKPF